MRAEDSWRSFRISYLFHSVMTRLLLVLPCCLLTSCAAVSGLTRVITAPIGGLLRAAPGLGSTALSLGMMGAALAADENRPIDAAAPQDPRTPRLEKRGQKQPDAPKLDAGNVTVILEQ